MYLHGEHEPVFALYHPPAAPARGPAVLLCPPFGWEDMCSYRARRDWAVRLAGDGHPVLRLDLPGTGDSGGSPRDPDLLGAWVASLASGARWLRAEGPTRRVAAVGVGLGGLLAWLAVAEGAPIDDLVLWGTPAKGRAYVRELKAFARMERTQFDGGTDVAGAEAADGVLSVAGYVLGEGTRRSLEAVDLAATPLPPGHRRVLLLGRDGRDPDAGLRAALEAAGAEVATGAGEGYGAMMTVEPQDSVLSPEVAGQVGAWLAAAPDAGTEPASATAAAGPPGAEQELEVPGAGRRVLETPLRLEHPFGAPFGVLTEPVGSRAGFCVVLLNAGPQRRTGPNRMWVEAARGWAARGVPTLRLDLAGIGDAEGDGTGFADPRAFYAPEYIEQARLALDVLEARGLPPRFLAGGLCVGGYWALQLALEDERVTGALLVNPGAFVYDGGMDRAAWAARDLAARLREPAVWRRLLRGDVTLAVHARTGRLLLRRLATRLLETPRARGRRRLEGDDLDRAFDRLRDGGRRALVVFVGTEPLLADLRRKGHLDRMHRWPDLRLEHVELPVMAHTLRPLWLQARVHALLDAEIDRELAPA